MIYSLAAVFLLVASYKNRRDLIWGIIVLVVPFVIYVIYMFFNAPGAFLFDIRFTFGRLREIPLVAQLPVTAFNYSILLTRDYWLVPAIIGLFILKPSRSQRLALLFFLGTLFLLGRTVGLAVSFSYYYLSPLFPFIALGMASLLYSAVPLVIEFTQSNSYRLFHAWGWKPDTPIGSWVQSRFIVFSGSILLFLVVAAPFVISVFQSFQSLSGGFSTAYDPMLIDPADAIKVAEFVNQETQTDDLVVTSPAIAWLIEAKVTDFQIALAAEGISTKHLPGDIPADRFEFDPRYKNARFVIIDPIWRNWAMLNIPEVVDMVQWVENWDLAYRVGEIEIYANPAKNY